MARGKNRNVQVDPAKIPPGHKNQTVWPYWLTAHALIHGGVVALITGVWWLGLLETVVHATIDFAKCEGWTNIHQDQSMHVACKVLWTLIA